MKHMLNKVYVFIFFLLLIGPGFAWGILGIISPATKESLSYDLGENRTLYSMPENPDISNLCESLEKYYNDHAPFRSMLISVHTKLDNALEKPYTKNLQPVIAKALFGDSFKTNVSDLTSLIQGEANEDSSINNIEEMEEAPIIDDTYIQIEEVPCTCTQDGYIRLYCEATNDEKIQIIPASGHKEEIIEKIDADYLRYGRTIYQCSVCGEKRFADFEEKLIDDSYLPCVIKNNYTVLGKCNWLFYRGNASLNYYSGANILSLEEKQAYTSQMQNLQTLCDEKGITLLFAIWPNKELVYSEYMPSIEIKNPVRRNEDFVQYLHENTDMNVIYPLQELTLGKLFYDTYYPYDAHWNNIGAFIGEQEILKALGKEPTRIESLDATLTDETERSLISTGALNDSAYTGDYDYILNYKPEIEVTTEINDEATGKKVTTSTSENDCNLVFIGDSFRIRLNQYLSRDFSKVTTIHRDTVTHAKNELQEANVIIISCVERFDKEMYQNLATVVDLLKKSS